MSGAEDSWKSRVSSRAFLLTAFLALLVGVTGCGGPAPSEPPAGTLSTFASASTAPVASDIPSEGVGLYDELAALVAPVKIYAPTSLPAGAEKAASWLPVIESTDPALYDGPIRPNPYVLGSGVDAEIQVVYTLDSGWIVVVENFLGDLGDVSGESVGEVAGHPANHYAVNGGDLVQWSDDGRWYGVFGRGVGRGAVLETALGMRVENVRSP